MSLPGTRIVLELLGIIVVSARTDSITLTYHDNFDVQVLTDAVLENKIQILYILFFCVITNSVSTTSFQTSG
jgi:hypothetical protein